MSNLGFLHNHLFARLEEAVGPWLLPSLARLVFAAVLLRFFLQSAWTKLGEWPWVFLPGDGAYIQILPGRVEAIGYDFGQLTWVDTVIVTAGTWAEVVLPLLIVAGLFTRLASLGMIGFVVVMSWVDLTGHGVDAETAGALFDRVATGMIWDQRALWVLLLAVLVVRGAGPVSADRALGLR